MYVHRMSISIILIMTRACDCLDLNGQGYECLDLNNSQGCECLDLNNGQGCECLDLNNGHGLVSVSV